MPAQVKHHSNLQCRELELCGRGLLDGRLVVAGVGEWEPEPSTPTGKL
jgi:hypothetical protein